MPARKGVPRGYNKPAHWVDMPRYEQTPGLRDLAERRIDGLALHAEWHPLRVLLASAYMQGINDALDALHQSGIALVPQELAQPND